MKSAKEIIGEHKFFTIPLKSDEEVQKLIHEQDLQEQRNLATARLLAIPPRYKYATFESYKTTKRQEWIINVLKRGSSCILFGKNGTGKTHLAFASMRYQIERGRDAQYILAADMFDIVKRAFDDKLRGAKALNKYRMCDYLIIDEVDKRYGSSTEFISLYQLINLRYNYMRPTLLLSNADENSIVEVIGSSIFDRIQEDGDTIYLEGKSYRGRG